jgi:uncharacterized membrane protein
MFGTVALGVWLESKFKWAARVSALVIILLLAIVFSNVLLIPSSAPVYDFVWDYFLPLSLPLMLFKSDIKKIFKESGQIMIAFIIGAIGTVVGTFVSYLIFVGKIEEIGGLAAMMTGTYIGGSVNFAVLGLAFNVSGNTISAATIADNLTMAIYFMILFAIPAKSKIASEEPVKKQTQEKTKPTLSTKDISIGIAVSAFIVAISDIISTFFSDIISSNNGFLFAMQSLMGNRYLWITTCTVVASTIFAEKFQKLEGLQEIGTFLIYCFIFVIGVPASIPEIIKNSPLMLLFALVIVAFNMLFTFIFGSIFRIDRRMLIIASNANVGGPTTAASMAVAKGWDDLVGPALLTGCFGYVIGNYLGIIVGNALL